MITKEAIDLYLSKLAPDGLILFNISSRYLDFRPVLGNICAASGLLRAEPVRTRTPFLPPISAQKSMPHIGRRSRAIQVTSAP